MKAWHLIIAGLFFLTACSVQVAHAPEDEIPAAAKTAVPESDPLPTNAVIRYRQSGGITRRVQEWIIFADGRVTTNDVENKSLGQDELKQALANIEATGFFELESDYFPADTCCDRLTYEVTVAQNGRTHTVTTLENTSDMPEALQQTLKLLDSLVVGFDE